MKLKILAVLILIALLTIKIQISPFEPNTLLVYADYPDSPTVVITYATP